MSDLLTRLRELQADIPVVDATIQQMISAALLRHAEFTSLLPELIALAAERDEAKADIVILLELLRLALPAVELCHGHIGSQRSTLFPQIKQVLAIAAKEPQ